MKRIKPYTQETTFTCGVGALIIAYKALGIDYNEPTLLLEMGVTKDGSDWQHIVEHVASRGFPLELKLRTTYKDLQKDANKGVVIVSWTTDWGGEPGGHFSVLSGILDDMIELTDPGVPEEMNPLIMEKGIFMGKWGTDNGLQSYLLIKPKSS